MIYAKSKGGRQNLFVDYLIWCLAAPKTKASANNNCPFGLFIALMIDGKINFKLIFPSADKQFRLGFILNWNMSKAAALIQPNKLSKWAHKLVETFGIEFLSPCYRIWFLFYIFSNVCLFNRSHIDVIAIDQSSNGGKWKIEFAQLLEKPTAQIGIAAILFQLVVYIRLCNAPQWN